MPPTTEAHPTTWAQRTIGAIALTARNRAIVRLQLAYLVLFGAAAMVLVAQAVVAFTRAGAGGVAILTVAQMLPTLVIVPIAAAVGQRVERRRLLLAALVTCTLATAGTAVLLAVDGPFIGLLLLAAVLAAGAGVTWSVMTAMLPDLAHGPEELVGANVAATAAEGIGGLMGPLLASVVLVVGGPAAVSAVAAAALVVGLAAAVGVRPPPAMPVLRPTQQAGRVRGLAGELSEGARILWRMPGPRALAIGAAAQTFVRGALGVLIVVLAFDVLDVGDTGVGWLTAAIGLGGLLGSGLTAGVMIGRRLGPAFGLALAAWGLPLVLLAPVASMSTAVLALTLVGIANAFVDVAGFGLMQGSIPDRQRTAALGAVRALVSLGMGAGGIAASIALAFLDPLVALALFGATLPVLTVLGWGRWRTLDDTLLVSRDQVAALRRSPLFAPLTLAQLEQLAAGSAMVHAAPGHVLITQGDRGDAYYLLTDGTVDVSIDGRLVSTLGPGAGFGEVALLRNTPRTATVTAMSAVTAYRVEAAVFVGAMSGSTISRENAETMMRGYSAVTAG